MPGKVKVKIVAGRNLPIMDRSSDTTDAFVEIKLGTVTQKTDVYRKSLNPQWNSEWFIFEVDDADLQDEPLQIRLMDYDTYSANDAIGKVYLDLNPLLIPQNALGRGNVWTETCPVQSPGGVTLSGWLPVFDTMHGMRGEVSVIVKVILFSDVNKFRQSSCGIQFFSTSATPFGFKIQTIHGFVKELVVNDDPEYQWIDKIRTPRASNEARQTLFSQLSGEVRRKIGLKVLELGGNAVIGYRQLFDLEGETGLVVRGIGTAVTLIRSQHETGAPSLMPGAERKENHGGQETSLRLHHSEPSLLLAPHTLIPRLSRLHSQPHDESISESDYGKANLKKLSASNASVVSNKQTMSKRKISLGSLLPRPAMFKNKWSRSREVLTSRPSQAKSQNSLLAIPQVVGGDDCGQGMETTCGRPLRVRSRSTPFNEMSPINECTHESHRDVHVSSLVPDPSDDLALPSISLTDFSSSSAVNHLLIPECSVVHVSHSFQSSLNVVADGMSYSSLAEEMEGETLAIVFNVGSSDDGEGSSSDECNDSELLSTCVVGQSASETVISEVERCRIHASDRNEGVDPSFTRVSRYVFDPAPIADKSGTTNINLNESSTYPIPSPDDELVSSRYLPIRSPRCVVASNIGSESNKQTSSQTRAGSPAPIVTPAIPVSTPTVTLGTPSKPTVCQRRSSDSEISVTPKGGTSLPDSVGSSGGPASSKLLPPRQNSVPATGSYPAVATETATLEVLEYPFLTMTNYPPGFIIHLGGTVSARSVKILLDRINNSEELETRDNWWTEIRMEIRSHARALGCNAILGYEEHTSICEEVCVFSAAGTAAVVNLQSSDCDTGGIMPAKELEHKRETTKPDHGKAPMNAPGISGDESKASHMCRVCHIPYSKSSIPFPIKLSRCGICRKGRVPDVLIATIEPPAGLAITGRGCLIQARLCRPKRDESRGDHQAKEVSDGLPFLEYELHRQLINKLRIKGMNAIFGLRVQVTIGESHMVGVATGTAVFLTALPAPSLPIVGSSNPSAKQTRLAQFQKILADAHNANRDRYGLKSTTKTMDFESGKWSDSDETDDEATDLDLSAGNKDTCVLEIDDAEDVDVIELLIDPTPVDGFDVVTTETVPGSPGYGRYRYVQAFTRVWKGKIPVTQPPRQFNRCFEMILRSICFKLRKLRPCVIAHLQFNVDLPEEDEIQITVLGTAIGGLQKSLESVPVNRILLKGSSEQEMIFHLEEDSLNEQGTSGLNSSGRQQSQSSRNSLDSKNRFQRERQPVDISSLMRLPGSRIERYLGHLNFFFIRESTSIREDGGLSGFMQSFITEVLAIIRAHVSALGGNAMVSYFMTECVLLHNPHKNQGQCLINVGGDVVQATRCIEKET